MVQDLTQFLDELPIDSHLRVETELGDGFVRLRTEEAERRQAAHDIRSSEDIVIEMLRNSRDAEAREIYVAASVEDKLRSITIIDDGCGIPKSMQQLVFEPRVTSKLDSMHMDRWGVHGRGMALYAVKVNCDSARVMVSKPNSGTSIAVVASLDRISEKSDQSTLPTLSYDGDGKVSMRGPRNLLRTCGEFAFEERKVLTVYFGSPTEIAATLYARSCERVSPLRRTFGSDEACSRVTDLLAYASDAADFASIANSIGLSISERSAQRILNQEILPADNLMDRILTAFAQGTRTGEDKGSATKIRNRNRSKIKVSEEDKNHLACAAAQAFSEIAEHYYLDAETTPSVRCDADSIIIKLPIREL